LTADNGSLIYLANSLMTIPAGLKTALKQIVAWNYANRGDLIMESDTKALPLPVGTQILLDQYSVAAAKIFSSGKKSNGYFW
jgi:hypothetical protein